MASETKNWPSRQSIDKALKTLSRTRGSMGLAPDASAMDRAKWELCSEFIKYLHVEDLSQRELAERLEVSEARVSEIVHYRIQKLTAEQLLKYLGRIKPNFKLKIG